MADISGKVALVTAGAQGIGLASVKAFAAAGCHVIATDINVEKLGEISGLPNIKTRVLNVLDGEMVQKAVDEIGRIDILFNCAGVVHNGTILDATEADLDFAFNLNVKAQMRMIKAVLPGMLERSDGAIVNMSSVASSVTAPPSRFVYTATKAAVIGLTKSVAKDFVGRGIRCNAICPGTVESPSLQDRMRATGDFETARAAFIARQPIGRLGKPEEIADLAVYLASATYTTGQIHVIDGGWTT
jgi:2-keto-3-deoxy-L-fuconate dehydrogenase